MDNDITVWEDKMLKPFATLISCRDTIYSECMRGLTLDQCVNECRDNPMCACGYYLKPSDGEKSYCAPLNAALLKNMNLHWNIYDKATDPTQNLWSQTAVFFRPNVYPVKISDDVVLMQRDICSLIYVCKENNKVYYLQEDLTWLLDGDMSAEQVLFIDKFPQFYELANNIQNHSNFILKIFSKPEVLAVDNNKLSKIPYLSVNPEKNIPDTYLYIPSVARFDPNSIDYPVLRLSSRFQILTDNKVSFLGVRGSVLTKRKISIDAIRWDGNDNHFTGYFQIIRKALQPNIFKVAEILPARLTFLEDSVVPLPFRFRKEIIIISVCIVFLIVMIVLLFIYR